MENVQTRTSCDSNKLFSTSALDDIKKLIQSNEDTAEGFSKAIEAIDNPGYQKLFSEIETDRRQFAAKLRVEALKVCEDTQLDDLPRDASTSSSVEQWWMKIKANMSSDELESVLCSAEEAEDDIKETYERVMSDQELPASIASLVREQYKIVKEQHDKIRDIRDIVKAN